MDARIDAVRLAGVATTRTGDTGAGIRLLGQAVRMARDHGAADAQLQASAALGDARAALGQRRAALTAYDEAARSVEDVSAHVHDDVSLAGYRAQHLAPLDAALRLLVRDTSSDASTLLAWSTRRKAAGLQFLLAAPSAARPSLDLARVQAHLASDEALLDYIVVDTTVAVLGVTRKSTTVRVLATPVDSLRAWIASLRRPVATVVAGHVDTAHFAFDMHAARRLYEALLGPLDHTISGVRRLTIAPDGVLHYVPFHALVIAPAAAGRQRYLDARYVIDRWTVDYVPSANAIWRRESPAVRAGPPGRLVALSYDTPGGDAEIASIRAVWPPSRVTLLTGSGATEAALATAARRADVLHLAVHANADDRDPLASHLRLAPGGESDGLLHVREIADHATALRVVVLSGCATLGGKLYAGEGLLSLARAYLLAGAKAVIATEWPIGAPIASMTGDLYQSLAAGLSPSAAVHAAALRARGRSATANPYYWGALASVNGY
jgi:CHAT domain-containing protein